jgi:hypothetical protein
MSAHLILVQSIMVRIHAGKLNILKTTAVVYQLAAGKSWVGGVAPLKIFL